MDGLHSREYESKQLADLITDIYEELSQRYEVLSMPDGGHGICKYIGSNPETQFYLAKISKKRDVKRTGLGFVIQRAEFPDHFRIHFDLEIGSDVTGKDSIDVVDTMNVYAQNEYGTQAPIFIIYLQPAHSGMRGWANKTFVGVEFEVTDRDFSGISKMRKKLVNQIWKLFYSVDYALTGN
ncbi:MAG: hypothetical protein C4527_18265 [Candidatus Omnitrophota bacterium]|jgi:hypothetical protein|nr:MAG: hypothetical protein C4527_18265 [Candidatus Omnitrophota bacterium]